MHTLKIISIIACLLLRSLNANSLRGYNSVLPKTIIESKSEVLFQQLNLEQLGLAKEVFDISLAGYNKLLNKGNIKSHILSIVDFTKSANKKRLFVIDLDNGKLLFNTLVAHGKNSGEEFAKYFSNEPSSLKSSLGFYTTMESFYGSHGLGMKLKGLEPGFNDKAEERAIVMHGATYVCNDFVCKYGRLGKSFGCPSVPMEVHTQIINAIKGGSCLFIYYPDNSYLRKSKIING